MKGQASPKLPGSNGGQLSCTTPRQIVTGHGHQVAFPASLLGHGTNSPSWQIPSTHRVGTSSWHWHQPAVCARRSQPPPESRTPTQIPCSAKAQHREASGRRRKGTGSPAPRDPLQLQKSPPPRGSNRSGHCRGAKSPLRGERGSPHPVPPQPLPQWGKSKRRGTHRSSWEGWMYPEERMFKDRMLGSMRDSSASGVFRIRPASAAQGCHSGNRQWPCEDPHKGQGAARLPAAPSSQAAAAQCLATQCQRFWSSSCMRWPGPRHPAHAVPQCHLPGSRRFATAGWEGRQGAKCRVGMWARNSPRGCSGAQQAGGCSQPSQAGSAYPQPAPALPSSG